MSSQDFLYSISTNVNEPIQQALVSIGIDSAWKTALFISALTGAGLYIAKPSALFNPDGSAKPWTAGSGDMAQAKMDGAVPVPWWLASLTVGYVTAQFI